MKIILASGSPRRKELFSLFGMDYTICAPHVDETITEDESPEVFCKRISMKKTALIYGKNTDSLVIGADTIVVLDGMILGKPDCAKKACDFLKILQDRCHEVFTAYTIMKNHMHITRMIRSKVYFRHMRDEEIQWYVSTGEPMDKAGAYAVQGIGALFIDRIDGSYTNVIGLPVAELYNDLKDFGLVLNRQEDRQWQDM